MCDMLQLVAKSLKRLKPTSSDKQKHIAHRTIEIVYGIKHFVFS